MSERFFAAAACRTGFKALTMPTMLTSNADSPAVLLANRFSDVASSRSGHSIATSTLLSRMSTAFEPSAYNHAGVLSVAH